MDLVLNIPRGFQRGWAQNCGYTKSSISYQESTIDCIHRRNNQRYDLLTKSSFLQAPACNQSLVKIDM